MKKVKLLLAEDHQVVRQGLRMLIETQDDLEVVGEAADGRLALQMICDLCPDVAIIDISMPLMNGLDLAKQLQSLGHPTRLLTLTANEDIAYMNELLQFGVSGYLLKRSASEDLLEAIRHVATGKRYMDPSIVQGVVDGLFGSPLPKPRSPLQELTDRELEVLKLIAHGQTNKEVASLLDISVKTVETHKARAMNKLNVRSRAEVVRLAIDEGWLN